MAEADRFTNDNPELETRIGMETTTPVAETPARTFMRELQSAERTGDLSALTSLFAEDAVLRRMTIDHHQSDRSDAHAFWRGYLDSFDEVRSEFDNVFEGIRAAVLEWKSHGRLKGGVPFEYSGVSIVDFDATGGIRGFRTYYDSAAFNVVKSTRAH